MSVVVEILLVLLLIVLLTLAVTGLWALWQYQITERARAMRQAKLVEQRITEIGLQAQAAILNEALKRSRVKPTADRPNVQWPPAGSLPGQGNDWR